AVEPLPAVSVPDRPPISKQSAIAPGPHHSTVPHADVEHERTVPSTSDHPENSTSRNSDSERPVPYVFYALLVLSGAAGSFILSKLLPPAMHPSPSVRENTPETRKAALQALLLKAEKKK